MIRLDRIIFDFDNTLFDTEARKLLFYRMAEIHGYSRDEAIAIYDRARTAQEKIMMSLSSYISVLREQVAQDGKSFLSQGVSAIIAEMHRGDGLLPGARSLLDFCVAHYVPLYLLSLGVREWQEEKVRQSGIGSYFPRDHVVYTDMVVRGKQEALRTLFRRTFDGSRSVLINDKPDETADLLREFPQMVAYLRMELRDPRYTVQEYQSVVDTFAGRAYVISELHECKTLLEHTYVNIAS